jgi:hypothetical protein
MEAKDRKYHSNPSMSKDFGQFSPPIPASMLAQMKAMKIQDDMEEASAQNMAESPRNHNTQPQKQSEELGQNKMITPTKRPRLSNTSNLDLTQEDTLMAGPAEQASQWQ